MATDILAQKFRATNGLDAGSNKVINVALADRTVGTDGTNVDYIIQENTIQQYDSTRGYLKNFSIIFQNRIWTALQDIPAPSGTFDQSKWVNLRTDPKWIYINSGSLSLDPGQYINADSRSSALSFTLPASPQDGDTIVVRDIGGNPGNLGISISASNQSVAISGAQVRAYNITIPFSTVTMTFSNRLWQTTVEVPTTHNTTLLGSAQKISSQAGDQLIPSGNGTFSFDLPAIANDRDEIDLTDVYGIVPLQHVTVYAPNGYAVGSAGKSSVVLKRKGKYRFILDLGNKLWNVVNEDYNERAVLVNGDTTLIPNQYVAVVGSTSQTSASTINLTLPTKSEIGDFVIVSLRKMSSLQTVNIVCAKGDVIQDNMGLLEFPRRSTYPQNGLNVTTLTINGATDYPGTYHLAYTEVYNDSTTSGVWYVLENDPTIEQVDPTSDANRARLGVISLATQAQAMVDHENGPSNNTAITPETLSNRVAIETRRGIARIATQDEVSQLTTATYADDIIVTPKKLNARAATETMRGLAEIATQSETNSGTDDTTIITPKKLQARQATPTMSGIAPLVTAGGTAVSPGTGVVRGNPGTGVYNNNDYANIVTPKVLGDYVATELSQGSVYLATNAEVINGTPTSGMFPTVVTPVQLQTKTATEGRIGFTQIATQAQTNAGTDDFTFVTPKKLQNRIASETLTGIARIATQDEFNSGSADNTGIVTPAKVAQYLTWTRTSVTANSGLVQSGNLWTTLAFDIQSSTETQRGTLPVSTQALTDAGVDDTTAVTPKKLQAKVATESVLGIIQFANAAETTAGTITTKAVSPGHLLNSFSVDSAWQATTSFRGTVKLTSGNDTWVGNDTAGSTQAASAYKSNGYAISPSEMNSALTHYLPRLATAANSLLLGGIAPDSWTRRDIAQNITGPYTFTQPTVMSNTLQVNSTVTSTGDVHGNSNIRADGYLFASGGMSSGFIPPSQGSYIGYDLPSGTGNTVLFNHQGNGTGGYAFYNSDGKTNTTLMNIDGNGNVTTNGGMKSSYYNIQNNSLASLSSGSLIIGDNSIPTYIRSKDANTALSAQDSTGSYNILNTKNMRANLDPIYVNQTGDTMSGRLTVNAATSLNGNTSWVPLTAPTTDSQGYWSVQVTDPSQYNTLPGYAVPTTQTDPITGTVFVVAYHYINAPGTLSQFGVGTPYTYQIWTPRADTATSGALAQTFWIRQYNPITSSFDEWGRMYTSNNPPTPGELGATSTVGTTLKNLTVTDWFKIGNVKIYPDETTKTVKFEWIDD